MYCKSTKMLCLDIYLTARERQIQTLQARDVWIDLSKCDLPKCDQWWKLRRAGVCKWSSKALFLPQNISVFFILPSFRFAYSWQCVYPVLLLVLFSFQFKSISMEINLNMLFMLLLANSATLFLPSNSPFPEPLAPSFSPIHESLAHKCHFSFSSLSKPLSLLLAWWRPVKLCAPSLMGHWLHCVSACKTRPIAFAVLSWSTLTLSPSLQTSCCGGPSDRGPFRNGFKEKEKTETVVRLQCSECMMTILSSA